MVEVNLGGGGEEAAEAASGGADVRSIMEQLEEMKEWVMENPEVAEMMGYDISALQDSVGEVQEAADGDGSIGVDGLLDLTGALVENGYGQYSVAQVHEYVQNNREQVAQLLEQEVGDGEQA